MKKVISILYLLIVCASVFGQSVGNDTSRYVWNKFQYGSRMPRFSADSVLSTPKDTAFSKDGIARIGKDLFLGDGSVWTFVGGSHNDGIDTIFVGPGMYVIIDSSGHQQINLDHADGLVYPGLVTSAGGMDLDITPALYYLSGIARYSPQSTITIAASDPILNRLDLIVGDSDLNIISILGTPAVNPTAPQYNPGSQVPLTTIYIPAGVTALPVSVEMVYNENVEWTTGSTGTITVDYNNTDNTHNGVKAAYVSTYDNAASITFTDSGPDTATAGEVVKFFIYLNIPFTGSFQIQAYNGSTPVSSRQVLDIQDGFNPLNVGIYQDISKAFSTFNTPPTIFNKIVLFPSGQDLSGAGGFYIDQLQLQIGINNYQIDYSNKVDSIFTRGDSLFQCIKGNCTYRGSVGSAVGGGVSNSNIGSGYRFAVPNTNNIKSLFNGYAIAIDSASNTNGLTLKADTSLLLTKLGAAALYTGNTGTVTSASGTPPINVASGTSTPVISITTADSVHAGAVSIPDWNKFNGKLPSSTQFVKSLGQYFWTPSTPALQTATMTIGSWVSLDSKANGYTIAAVDDDSSTVNSQHLTGYVVSVDRFQFQIETTAGTISVAANNLGSPTLNTWYNVVGWYSSTTNRVYIQVNNGAIDSAAVTGTLRTSTSPFTIGANRSLTGGAGGLGTFMNGRIAKVGLWQRVLTAAERTALYNQGAGLYYNELSGTLTNNLLSWWDLQNGSGLDRQGVNNLTAVNVPTPGDPVQPFKYLPIIKGGEFPTSSLNLVSTNGTGTTDSIHIGVGTNGSVRAIDIPHSGNVIITHSLSVNNAAPGAAAANLLTVNPPTTNTALANNQFSAGAVNQIPVVIQGFPSQATALQQWQTSTGAVVANLTNQSVTNFTLYGKSAGAGAYMFYNDGPDNTNAGYVGLGIDPTISVFGQATGASVLSSGKNGSGTIRPFIVGFYNAGFLEALHLSTNGNIGAGYVNPTAGIHLRPGTSAASMAPLKFGYTSLATTAASGTGTVVTLTFASQGFLPFNVGSKVVVSGVTPVGYNGTFTVATCTLTTITYSGSGSGTQTIAGTIAQGHVLTTPEAGALEYDNTHLYLTNGGLIRQEIPQIQQTVVGTQFDKTSSTALADITGLTATVVAGKVYRFEAILYTTSNVGGGVKFAVAGAATATNIIYEDLVLDANVNAAQTRGTALAAAVGGVTAVTNAYSRITGTITVNAAGTLTVQFAQNASNGTASSVLVGSTFVVTQIN